MLRSLLSGGDPKNVIISLLLSLPVVLLALSLHETAHGYVAYKLGDPTAKNLGRLTLNPVSHLDPIGCLCMLLAGFGWAKPVPINTRYFKKPRRDMALSAAAGPISNILLAAVFCALLKVYSLVFPQVYQSLTPNAEKILVLVCIFLNYGVYLNVSLAVFNLLPVPPFDGSRIFYVFLPPKLYFGIMKYEKYIYLGIMALLLFGVLSPIISFVSEGIMGLFSFIFRIPSYYIL